ncbi:hypothetical protein LSUE1_G000985 [Lachnellula suecica]|uniref:Thioesterase domain-containing protein n=1 Tax=Lachnellula suecica TaxID=602035 RepID=A0A8T9CEW0_9HELO|nr:hypothetical protein LSUE1_G000985 [Lachnellula suecica]
MASKDLKGRRKQDYLYFLDYRTRWYDHIHRCEGNQLIGGMFRSDNDMYDHLNNSIYNFLYDSIVNTYLINECGLHPPTSSQYGLVVHSHGDFFGSIAFPAIADLGLRVNKLGKSSVTYEIGLFERGGGEDVKAVGEMIHVFVDRETGRPAANGMDTNLKEGLQKLLVSKSKL